MTSCMTVLGTNIFKFAEKKTDSLMTVGLPQLIKL